jgi:hypothetical protein
MGHRSRTSLVNRSPSAGVVAGTGAKEPWWAAGAATWAEIAEDVEEGTMVAAAPQLGACFGLADGVDMSGATTLVMSVG